MRLHTPTYCSLDARLQQRLSEAISGHWLAPVRCSCVVLRGQGLAGYRGRTCPIAWNRVMRRSNSASIAHNLRAESRKPLIYLRFAVQYAHNVYNVKSEAGSVGAR